jgi:outer membrane murein-binding lipoprotein Lpp
MIKQRTVCLSLLALVIAFCLFMTGCERKEGATEHIAKLQKEVQQLTSQVERLSSGFAVVITEDKGYSIAHTRFGAFAIACDEVSRYEEGYKVHLAMGNLTSANFRGAKILVSWGKSGFNKREIDVHDDFPAGRYTGVEFVMTPATSEDIKKFNIVLDFDEMALLQ